MLKSSKRINQVRTKMVCISKSLRCSLVIFLGEPSIEVTIRCLPLGRLGEVIYARWATGLNGGQRKGQTNLLARALCWLECARSVPDLERTTTFESEQPSRL